MTRNHQQFSLRSILEKDKLNGTNYTDWIRNLRIVLRAEKKEDVLDTPLPEEPTDDAPAVAKNAYKKACDNNLEVSCLMLACMEPELQMQFETNHEAHDMIMVLQDMFQTQAKTEMFNVSKSFVETKLAKGTTVGPHVIKMVGYTRSWRSQFMKPLYLSKFSSSSGENNGGMRSSDAGVGDLGDRVSSGGWWIILHHRPM